MTGPKPHRELDTLVISLHPETRDAWLLTGDLDEEELEAHVQREIREEERREREAQAELERQKMPVTRVQLPPVPANAYSPKYDPD